MASKCLREHLAQADERGLAASALACLERCLPLISSDAEALRPLWAGLAKGAEDWSTGLAKVRDPLMGPLGQGGVNGDGGSREGGSGEGGVRDEGGILVRQMLAGAPPVWTAGLLRAWADACSLAALELHHRFDARSAPPAGTPGAGEADVAGLLKGCREGDSGGAGPLVNGELRRQIRVLEILAGTEGGVGLRQALVVSTEGQRVLRAVVSRRSRVGR
ncbi:hypothetical protein ACIBCM_21005 [Streptomyces sp. NPDC051018]|uniref:hypothetical protein n=1 Tax=Streptomyces sp. NPDC051018 TaxID=3365639 RepID=UPI0037A1BA94